VTVAQLRARLQAEHNETLGAVLGALLDCAETLEAWRDAVCAGQTPAGTGGCYGDNHIETCPVEIARQGLIAADDQRRGLR